LQQSRFDISVLLAPGDPQTSDRSFRHCPIFGGELSRGMLGGPEQSAATGLQAEGKAGSLSSHSETSSAPRLS
jgi:hypothetical protein